MNKEEHLKIKREQYHLYGKYKAKQYHIDNKERINAQKREYNKTHPEIVLKCNLNQLIKHGKTFDITTNQYMYTVNVWVRSVKTRDKTCVCCGSKKQLNAHHILYKSKYPELSLNLNNGITMCKKCHEELHGYGVY